VVRGRPIGNQGTHKKRRWRIGESKRTTNWVAYFFGVTGTTPLRDKTSRGERTLLSPQTGKKKSRRKGHLKTKKIKRGNSKFPSLGYYAKGSQWKGTQRESSLIRACPERGSEEEGEKNAYGKSLAGGLEVLPGRSSNTSSNNN